MARQGSGVASTPTVATAATAATVPEGKLTTSA
jgi:hypothetical protein